MPFETETEWLQVKKHLDEAILERWSRLGHVGAAKYSYDRAVFNYGRGKLFCETEEHRMNILALMLELGMDKHVSVPKQMLPERSEPRRVVLQFRKIELYPGPTSQFLDHLRGKHNITSDFRIIHEGRVNLHGEICNVVTVSVTSVVATYIAQKGWTLSGPVGQIKFFGKGVSKERRISSRVSS